MKKIYIPSPQRNAVTDYGDQVGPYFVFRVWFQRPNVNSCGDYFLAGRILVVAGSRGKFSRGGRFPYKKIRNFPKMFSSREKGCRGGQFPSEHTREFPWWPNLSGQVPKVSPHTVTWMSRRRVHEIQSTAPLIGMTHSIAKSFYYLHLRVRRRGRNSAGSVAPESSQVPFHPTH